MTKYERERIAERLDELEDGTLTLRWVRHWKVLGGNEYVLVVKENDQWVLFSSSPLSKRVRGRSIAPSHPE
jgi:hypothetical protein